MVLSSPTVLLAPSAILYSNNGYENFPLQWIGRYHDSKNPNSSLHFAQAALVSPSNKRRTGLYLIRTFFFSIFFRYLAGDSLDSDDSDNNDEDDDDDQPDEFERSCNDETNESHKSKLDEMLATFRARARSLQQELNDPVESHQSSGTSTKSLLSRPFLSANLKEAKRFLASKPVAIKFANHSVDLLALHVKRVHGAKSS